MVTVAADERGQVAAGLLELGKGQTRGAGQIAGGSERAQTPGGALEEVAAQYPGCTAARR